MHRFPYTEVKSLSRWTNYAGTLAERPIPIYCTPDVLGHMGGVVPRKLRRQGDALKSIVAHCFETPGLTFRAVGSRWSFSNVGEPGQLIVDPANLNAIFEVNPDWLETDYRIRRASHTPVLVQGGTHIARLNRRLAERGLALRTSGAGDGHRIAGCLATGTHGSALSVGAVHDTVLAFHLLTAPDQSILLQPRKAACGDEVVQWLRKETGWFVEKVNDDELFSAAQVNLGSLGFVHAVVVETEPLYSLEGLVLNRPFGDLDVWNTLSDLDTRRLHPEIAEHPFHFEVLFNPYPVQGRPGAFVTCYWKRSAGLATLDSPMPVAPSMASDHMCLIADLSNAIDGPLSALAVRLLVAEQLEKRFKPGMRAPALPGMVFGPTGLPPGYGASTEVVVDQARVRRVLELLYEILSVEGARGNHLLGAVAVRFVPRGDALLGMNLNRLNAYIELPSIRNPEVLNIYRLWWDALERDGISFTCHWGQLHGLNPERVERYFGDRVPRWRAARDRILFTDEGKRVFSSKILSDAGLD